MSNYATTKRSSSAKPERRTTDSANVNQESGSSEQVKLADAAGDAVSSFRKYAAQRPDVVALWAFGVGFVLGWRLKPW